MSPFVKKNISENISRKKLIVGKIKIVVKKNRHWQKNLSSFAHFFSSHKVSNLLAYCYLFAFSIFSDLNSPCVGDVTYLFIYLFIYSLFIVDKKTYYNVYN